MKNSPRLVKGDKQNGNPNKGKANNSKKAEVTTQPQAAQAAAPKAEVKAEAPKAEVAKPRAPRAPRLAPRGHEVTFQGRKYLITDARAESYSGIDIETGKVVALEPNKCEGNRYTPHGTFVRNVLDVDKFKGEGLDPKRLKAMRDILTKEDMPLKKRVDLAGEQLWHTWPPKPETPVVVTAKR